MFNQPIPKTALAFLAGAIAIGLVSTVALVLLAKDSFSGLAADDYKVESVTNTYYRAGVDGRTIMNEGGFNVTKVNYTDPNKTDLIRGYDSCIVHGQTSYTITYPPKTADFALVNNLPQVKTSGSANATIASLGKTIRVTLEIEAKQTSLNPKKYEVGCRFYDATTRAEVAHTSLDGKFASPYALIPVFDGTFAFRVGSTSNAAPTVSITAPTNGQQVSDRDAKDSSKLTEIDFKANASDSDGTITKVEFFQDGTLIGADTATPYAVRYAPTTTGSHTLTAKATDNLGKSTTSAAVRIEVFIQTQYLGPPGTVGP